MDQIGTRHATEAGSVSAGRRARCAPPPRNWHAVRVVGVVGGALATAPVSLPASIVALSGYLITAGTIITTVSQITVEENK